MVRTMVEFKKVRSAQWETLSHISKKTFSSSTQLTNEIRFLFVLHHGTVHYLSSLLKRSQRHKLSRPGRASRISNLIM